MIVQGSFEYRYSNRAWPWVEPGSENVRTENGKESQQFNFCCLQCVQIEYICYI